MITWWYSEGRWPVGPVDFDCIRRLVLDGRIGPKARVWHHEMDAWLTVEQVPELVTCIPRGDAVAAFRRGAQGAGRASQITDAMLWQRIVNAVTGLALIALLMFVAATGLKAILSQRASDRMQAAEALALQGMPGQLWQNPVTRHSIRIDPRWQITTRSSRGQTDYLFSDGEQRMFAKLTMERGRGLSLPEFADLIRQKTAPDIKLHDAGSFGARDGRETWEAEGHLADRPDLLLRVQLAQEGSAFWQVITLRSTTDTGADEMLSTLKTQLWKTVTPAY